MIEAPARPVKLHARRSDRPHSPHPSPPGPHLPRDDEHAGLADEFFERLCAAVRRGATHESRRWVASLASIGYRTEYLAGVGLRLIPLRVEGHS